MAYCPPTTDGQERDNLIETLARFLRRSNVNERQVLRKLTESVTTEHLINVIHDLDGSLCGVCHVGQMVRKGGTDVCNSCGEKA